MDDDDVLMFEDGSVIEIYKDETGKKLIGKDTLKGRRYFGCVYCHQENDEGEKVIYKAFAIIPSKRIVQVVRIK